MASKKIQSRHRELKIVQSIREIEKPNIKLHAIDVSATGEPLGSKENNNNVSYNNKM